MEAAVLEISVLWKEGKGWRMRLLGLGLVWCEWKESGEGGGLRMRNTEGVCGDLSRGGGGVDDFIRGLEGGGIISKGLGCVSHHITHASEVCELLE